MSIMNFTVPCDVTLTNMLTDRINTYIEQQEYLTVLGWGATDGAFHIESTHPITMQDANYFLADMSSNLLPRRVLVGLVQVEEDTDNIVIIDASVGVDGSVSITASVDMVENMYCFDSAIVLATARALL